MWPFSDQQTLKGQAPGTELGNSQISSFKIFSSLYKFVLRYPLYVITSLAHPHSSKEKLHAAFNGSVFCYV